MKKITVKLIALFSIAIFMFGCAKVEPTALKIDNIPDKVKVQGVVQYDAKKKDGTVKPDIKNKSGAVVSVDIKLEEYNTDSIIVSSKRYTATTNGDGYYSISVPSLPNKSLNYEVSVEFEETTLGKDFNGDTQTAKAIFQYSASHSTYCGQTNVLNIMAVNKGFPQNPGLTQY